MKIALNGREVRVGSIEMENVLAFDYPDFCDAFVGYAEFVDGVELNENEKLEIENKFRMEMNMLAHESFH